MSYYSFVYQVKDFPVMSNGISQIYANNLMILTMIKNRPFGIIKANQNEFGLVKLLNLVFKMQTDSKSCFAGVCCYTIIPKSTAQPMIFF